MKRLITFAGIIILGLLAITLFSTCEIDSVFVDLIQGKIDADSGVGSISLLTMVNVPAGSFQRDSTPENISVITTAFGMSEHEITRDQFSAIMGADPSYETYSSGTSDPVQRANWYHVIAFCNKLSIAESLTPVYSVSGVNFNTLSFGDIPTTNDEPAYSTWNAAAAAAANWSVNGYRLPTEMEWMWAAMGAIDDYTKPFAGSDGTNDIGDYAWYWENSGSKTHPVGTTGTTGHANELGLYDMSGNVWEWNWDLYASSYPSGKIYSNTADGRGADSGAYRVIRGGGFSNYAFHHTVAERIYSNPYYPDYSVGFRVVRP